MKLSELGSGKQAIISSIVGQQLPSATKRKLLSMGVTPQSRVQVIRRAPLGSNIEIKIRGSLLCLRKDLAENIFVEECK
ncbi:FeoA family protein [Paraferrimonas haliotis]|uniref:Iron transporter FeoA n=1 Tax=Paraferrimonas haliotis TaxID=2013866 RepID=A0AA37WZV4_9GAMM|nr:FeoA family protein [Paraferrimonas haliotis]GLS84246.1 iron transporter FeoA [Paraferrimonas haliotis]